MTKSMPLLERRLGFGIGLAISYVFVIALTLAADGGVGSGYTQDTAGYLDFSPYRQPLYGLWANSLHRLTASWEAVLYVQVAMFAASVGWVLTEMALIPGFGVGAALLLAVTHVVLLKMGLVGLVSLLGTEGLFYPAIMASGALLLLWLRTGSKSAVVWLVIVMVLMTQLRTAALLVILVPVSAALVALYFRGMRSPAGKLAIACLATTVIALMVGPVSTGKSLFQVSTVRSSMGFALFPRISLLPPSQSLPSNSAAWDAMTAAWRLRASQLDSIEVSQFDAQLQEAIRFDLGPKLLLPAMLGISSETAQAEWGSGVLYDRSKDIALRWIGDQWQTYAKLSAAYLWATMTMGNYMGEERRQRVWAAVESLPPPTWEPAPLRKDYPLNHIFEPLSPLAKAVYLAFRSMSILALLIALACGVQLLGQLARGRMLAKGSLALVMAAAWTLAHSIPIALTVFPEIRYTYANFLALSVGGLAWLAYLKTAWSSRPHLAEIGT
jgi:hypothetical protein